MLKITGICTKVKVVDAKAPDDGVHRTNETGRLKHPKMMLLDGQPLFYGNESFYRKIDDDRGIKVYYSFNTGIALRRNYIEFIRERMRAIGDFCVQTGDIVPVEIDLIYKGRRICRNAWGLEVENICAPKKAWTRYCRGKPYSWKAVDHPDHTPDGFRRFVQKLTPHIFDDKNTTLGSIMWGKKHSRWYLIDVAMTEDMIREIKQKEIAGTPIRKAYIDCGAFIGDTIKAFMTLEKDSIDYEIYAFEANPYSRVHKKYGHLFNVYNKAVWIEDCKLPFYIKEQGKEGQGSSLLKEKASGGLDKKHPIMVEAVDFGKWVKDNFALTDYVVVKMDIEGAEYKVLPKMIEDGSINLVDRLYLETHENRIGLGPNDYNRLMKQLRAVPGLEVWKSFSEIVKRRIVVRAMPSRPTTDSESARLRFYRKMDYLPSEFKCKPITNEFRGDVLYIQKRAEQIPLIQKARAVGMPVVYDSDDGDGVRRKGDDRPVFPLVSAITTDSEERAEAFRKLTATPVYVVPDGIDYLDKRPEPAPIGDTIKRVCTFGSDRSTRAAILYLERIEREYDVSYITKTEITALRNSKFIAWKYHKFIKRLMEHDICFLVHEETDEKPFKGNTRLITAMSVGIPAIVSNTPSYVSVLRDCGLEELVMNGIDDLVPKIEMLKDRDKRRDIQARFMDYAWKHYDPHDMALKLATVFKEVINGTDTNIQQ